MTAPRSDAVSAFEYDAVDQTGRKVRGRDEAATAASLIRSLETRGMLVVAVRPSPPRSGTMFLQRGRRREVLEVTRALAALLPAGMPLVPALAAATGVAGPHLAHALRTIRARVESGESLAAALAAHPQLFSPLYVGLVRAGERSGRLDDAFLRLTAQLERDAALRSRLLSAMIYPLLLAVAGGIAMAVLLFVVLPRFADLLRDAGGALPRSTALVLAVATTMRQHWLALAAMALASVAFAQWLAVTREGRRVVSRLALATPGVRAFRQHAIAARYARVVSVLLAGGAPLLSALDDAIALAVDPVARDELVAGRRRVRDGASLRQAVAEGPIFPPLFAQLVGVGEDAGRLREFLAKAADIFEERTERAAQRLATLAEPAMIIVFGAGIAVVALSLLQAIYGINAGSFR
jgi:type II secretory pathway component PulF